MRSLLLMMLFLCGCSRPAIWKGVYSAEQSARGQRVYEDRCVVCHYANLTGLDSRLKGKRFMSDWREDTLNSLFIQMKKGMPPENPSSLSDAEYLDVLTYILEENGFPRGRDELRLESLESIALVGRDGPGPLPEGAIIQTSGCLTREAATERWTLRNAVAFTRARNPRQLSREELDRLNQQRPGMQTVDLNIARFRAFVRRVMDPANLIGRNVVIRGRLENATGTPRVMIFSVEDIGSDCR